jgi:hypothetical protein
LTNHARRVATEAGGHFRARTLANPPVEKDVQLQASDTVWYDVGQESTVGKHVSLPLLLASTGTGGRIPLHCVRVAD